MVSEDGMFMLRAIELGELALGFSSPNPAVGCVIVADNKVIGEGFTSMAGGPHAEVNAINSVRPEQHHLLKEATLYVTLEPCSHHGKTPPCSDLIIGKKIKRVVIGCLDPNPLVVGKGLARLKDAGIQVENGILNEECEFHHRRFLCRHRKNRPYIILKWAMDKNGYLAPIKDKGQQVAPVWISNQYSQQLVHKWRSQEGAFLVGAQTVIEDNPSLTTRHWIGKNPLRIALDPNRRSPLNSNLFNDKADTLHLYYSDSPSGNQGNIDFKGLDRDKPILIQLFEKLIEMDINSLVVEGGANTLARFIEENHWDEARIFTGNQKFNNGVEAPKIDGRLISEEAILEDKLQVIINDQSNHI